MHHGVLLIKKNIYIYQKILQKFLVFSLLILLARMKCQILHFQCINYICRLIFIKITWLSRQKIIAASKLINDWGAVWIASFLNIWDETTVNSKFTTNFEVSIAPTKINNWKCTRFRTMMLCITWSGKRDTFRVVLHHRQSMKEHMVDSFMLISVAVSRLVIL